MTDFDMLYEFEQRATKLRRKLSFAKRDGRKSRAAALQVQYTIACNMINKTRTEKMNLHALSFEAV